MRRQTLPIILSSIILLSLLLNGCASEDEFAGEAFQKLNVAQKQEVRNCIKDECSDRTLTREEHNDCVRECMARAEQPPEAEDQDETVPEEPVAPAAEITNDTQIPAQNITYTQSDQLSIVVDAENPVCDAVFNAEVRYSNGSAIQSYYWEFGSSAVVWANGTGHDTALRFDSGRGDGIQLDQDNNYVFLVYTLDSEGHVNLRSISNFITYDPTGVACDSEPPDITIVKSQEGDSVEIVCHDDLSGCSTIESYYGTSYGEEECTTNMYFLGPVIIPLTSSVNICWNIRDKNWNLNQGYEVIPYP